MSLKEPAKKKPKTSKKPRKVSVRIVVIIYMTVDVYILLYHITDMLHVLLFYRRCQYYLLATKNQ